MPAKRSRTAASNLPADIAEALEFARSNRSKSFWLPGPSQLSEAAIVSLDQRSVLWHLEASVNLRRSPEKFSVRIVKRDSSLL
jgi:hypothetical protein